MTQVVHEVSQALLFLFVQEIIIVHLQDVQCYKEAVHASLEFSFFHTVCHKKFCQHSAKLYAQLLPLAILILRFYLKNT